MKKFMILLLSLAVLFSFAACDNSSDTPADEPSTPVGPNNADAFVADALDAYFNGDSGSSIDPIFTALATEADATVGTDEVSLTYTFVDEDAVGSTPARLITVTVTGKDITPSASASGATRSVRLESYTMNAAGYDDTTTANVLSYNVANLTGSLQGSVTITKAVTTTTPATPASISSGTLKIDRVFAPASVGSVSVSDANGTYAVDSEDFLAQMSALCKGSGVSAQYITESAYTTAMKAEYQTKIDAYVDGLAANLVGTFYNGLVGKSGVSVAFVPGSETSKASVTVTYNVPNSDLETDEKVLVGSENASGITTYLKEGTTFTAVFEAAANGVSTSEDFQAATVVIGATLVVDDKTSGTNVEGSSNLVISGLTAAVTSGETITVANYTTAGQITDTTAFAGITTAPTSFTAGTATVNDATVAADVTATSTETVTYPVV